MGNLELMKESLGVAISKIGVKEIPPNSNRGPEVEAFLWSVVLPPGNPYCMAFVFWCVGEAAKKVNLENPLPKTGYTPTFYNWVRKGCLDLPPVSGMELASGSLFLLFGKVGNEPNPRVKHVGFCERLDGEILTTVEGNVEAGRDDEGVLIPKEQREGGIYRLKRSLSTIFKVVTYG